MLPAPQPIPVASAGVRRDVQNRGIRVGALTHSLPPVPNRGHRKRRRIVVASHAHPRFIAGHVEDAVRNRLALRVAREIVHAHRQRRRLRLPFPTRIREVPDQLLLLGVDRDHRLSGVQKPVRRRIDVFELLVAVGMNRAFLPFAHRLQPVAQAVEQPTHGGRAHAPSLLRQRRGQLRRGSCTSTATGMSGPRGSADLRALRGPPEPPAGTAQFPGDPRPEPECGSSAVHPVRSRGVPCGPSPALNRGPSTPARPPHSQWPATRPLPTVGDCARPTPAHGNLIQHSLLRAAHLELGGVDLDLAVEDDVLPLDRADVPQQVGVEREIGRGGQA